MIGEDTPWPLESIDSDSAPSSQFRRELHDSNLVSYFSSVEDFRFRVVKALAELVPRSARPLELTSFNAFLSYNSSSDRETVQAIAKQLMKDGVRVWMDVTSLRPGDKWEELTNNASSRVATVVASAGPSGVEQWQRAEIELAVGKEARVIPVLLPGTDSEGVPSDLRRFRWIAFSSLDDSFAYRSLLSAIRPGAYSPPPTLKEVSLSDADLELLADVLFNRLQTEIVDR